MHRQLYTITKQDYRLPIAMDTRGRAVTAQADNIPMLSWPNNHWCFEANLYMLELYERGLSRRNGGGTLAVYAANISHLLRYCFDNRTDLLSLTDSQFTLFIRGLQVERKKDRSSIRVRDANTIINIGRNCLDFLNCIGRFHNQLDFVSKNGRIRAERKEIQINIDGSSKTLRRSFWHHHAFPTPDCKVRVLPISSNNITKLREAVIQSSTSTFLRRRRQIMLMMLEVTGGRRGEIVRLTIDSVMKAQAMPHPMLDLITLKKRSSPIRQIPIPRPDLDLLVSFIEKQRRRIVKEKLGNHQDHGYVFVSETSGQPLNAQTISQEMYALAKTANINEKAHAHMFRHRFITKLFVSLIEQHAFENVDDFRRALLDTETLKQKVQQWTGHTQTSSLDIYIDLAFEEATNFQKTYDAVALNRVIESTRTHAMIIRQEINSGLSCIEAMSQFEQLLCSFEEELKC
ncbi:MAG: site-specific integrase [Gammaproteobacteria bacterium]|nr:site-specific integrase [Gammaproteobacteria bacterium]